MITQGTLCIAIGGFTGDSSGCHRLSFALKQLGIDTPIVEVPNHYFDIKRGVNISTWKGRLNLIRFGSATLLKTLRYNPVAHHIANIAHSHYQQNPNLKIVLIGHSAGGIAARIAAKLLEACGVEVQVVCIGSPWFGVKRPKNCVTLASKQDPICKFSAYRPVWCGAAGHSIDDYFACPAVQELIRSFIPA